MTMDRDELDTLAGEYVLGLLDGDERAAFEAALADDPDARAALRNARERFAELDAAAPSASVPEGLWARIEDRLDGERAVQAQRGEIIPLAPLRRGFWQGFALASAAAVALAVVWTAAVRPVLFAPEPTLIVVLLDAQSQPEAIVEAYASSRVRIVPLSVLEVPAGKTLQVWTLPSEETGPVSIGLMERSGQVTFSDLDLPPPRVDQLYEITIENAGGSPTGRPTGPIVAKGFAKQPQL